MVKMTHKARILVFLRARQPNWISSAEIERMSDEWAVRPSTVGRRLRELHQEGRIQRQMNRGIAWYRLTQSPGSN